MNSTLVKLDQHVNTPEYRQRTLSEHLDDCWHKQFHFVSIL